MWLEWRLRDAVLHVCGSELGGAWLGNKTYAFRAPNREPHDHSILVTLDVNGEGIEMLALGFVVSGRGKYGSICPHEPNVNYWTISFMSSNPDQRWVSRIVLVHRLWLQTVVEMLGCQTLTLNLRL